MTWDPGDELVRAKGGPARELAQKVCGGSFSNALVIGSHRASSSNLGRLAQPEMRDRKRPTSGPGRAAAALFGLGGVLAPIPARGRMRVIPVFICAVSLILHPART